MGGARKAWTVAAVMPGNRRNVAEGVQLGRERHYAGAGRDLGEYSFTYMWAEP